MSLWYLAMAARSMLQSSPTTSNMNMALFKTWRVTEGLYVAGIGHGSPRLTGAPGVLATTQFVMATHSSAKRKTECILYQYVSDSHRGLPLDSEQAAVGMLSKL